MRRGCDYFARGKAGRSFFRRDGKAGTSEQVREKSLRRNSVNEARDRILEESFKRHEARRKDKDKPYRTLWIEYGVSGGRSPS